MQSFWLSDIAPQYFDFEDTNIYKIGMFGYINEVLATVTQDVFNAVNIAKREFYTSTAQNISSFYKHAGDYDIPIPVANPARCNLAIYILEKDIISNASVSDDTYTFILDNTIEIMADSIQFTIDYPIRILARYLNGQYSYTTYYDNSKPNSLATNSSKYIQNKVIGIDGRKYLVMSIEAQQYTVTNESQNITRNSDIESVSLIFQYTGQLAGFDIYYTENPGVSLETHIPSFSANEVTPAGPYCIYDFLSDNKIRFTFPKNSYFAPRMNSEIRCAIYTTEGESGNFDEFLADLTCACASEEYPYNNGITVRGVVNGKSSGGKNKKTNEEFMREIRNAVCTNKTITNAADLQVYFNSIVDDPRIRIEFSKQRDDPLQRLYSSFILLKDDAGNVMPTNSCNLYIHKNEFDSFEGDRGVIRPGKIMKYSTRDDGRGVELTGLTLADDFDIDDENTDEFYFTNPFLICISAENGVVGYYGNSISEIKETEFSFVEDRSFNQFICLGLQAERNPIAGETYYKITAKISASSDIDSSQIVQLPDKSTEVIRAKYNGKVIETYFEDNCVWYKVEYATDNPDEKYQLIQASTYAAIPEGETEYVYYTGYDMQFKVLDTFIADDILAVKKVTDLGKLRGNIDLDNSFINNSMYIPMYIEDYDAEADCYIMRAYISTSDFISLNQTIVLDKGIYMMSGEHANSISVPMENVPCTVSIFYKDDTANYTHKYKNYEYFKNHTLTNQYTTCEGDALSLIKGITFIKSNLKFISTATTDTVFAKYDGQVTNMYTENNNIYVDVTYDVGDDTTETETILVKIGTPGINGSVSYVNEYAMNYEVSDTFTAGSALAVKKIYNDDDDGSNYLMQLSLVPLTKASWIKSASNFNVYIDKIYKTYDALFEAYFLLENQYGIAFSLFNTYGKSNRYNIGNYHDMRSLTSVNCSLSVGVELTAMTNSALFIDKFRAFVKDEIESFNDVNDTGKSLYIIDILAAAKEEFPEIIHLEYYGFNNYGTTAQVISPKEETVTTASLQRYVPEFVNIYTSEQNGVNVPKIDIRLLNYVAVS